MDNCRNFGGSNNAKYELLIGLEGFPAEETEEDKQTKHRGNTKPSVSLCRSRTLDLY